MPVQRGRHGPQARPGLLRQADELPDAQPHLPLPRAVVSRVAAAAVRVRVGVPVREVRCGSRPHPGSRVHPGRRAHLLHTRAGQRRADEHPAVRAATAQDYGLDDFYLELSTKNPAKYVGSDEVWERPPRPCGEVAEASGLELVPDPGGAAFYGPKISVQVKGRAGPHLADVDDAVGLLRAGLFELEIHRLGRHQKRR